MATKAATAVVIFPWPYQHSVLCRVLSTAGLWLHTHFTAI